MRYIAFAALLGAACTSAPDELPSSVATTARNLASDSAGSGSVEYKTLVQADIDSRSVGLCELSRFYTAGSGVYRVSRMIGVTEQVPDGAKGSRSGYTYVDLQLQEPWTQNAPVSPQVRVSGGPSAKPDVTMLWSVALTLDEQVAVMLEDKLDSNAGYLGLRTLALFHLDESGHFTNGQLTFTPEDLARAITGIFEQPGSVDCDALLPPRPISPEPPTPGVDIKVPSEDGPTEDGGQLPPQVTGIKDDPRPAQTPPNQGDAPE